LLSLCLSSSPDRVVAASCSHFLPLQSRRQRQRDFGSSKTGIALAFISEMSSRSCRLPVLRSRNARPSFYFFDCGVTQSRRRQRQRDLGLPRQGLHQLSFQRSPLGLVICRSCIGGMQTLSFTSLSAFVCQTLC
jgi:hypothetical protein